MKKEFKEKIRNVFNDIVDNYIGKFEDSLFIICDMYTSTLRNSAKTEDEALNASEEIIKKYKLDSSEKLMLIDMQLASLSLYILENSPVINDNFEFNEQ